MTSEIKPFRAYHIIGEHSIEGMDDDFQKKLALMFQMTDGHSLFINGQFIMAGGIVKKLDGVGVVWLFVTNRIKKHMKTCIKYAKMFLEKGLEIYHRLEISVKVGFDAGCDFAEHFGFSYEGVQRAYDMNKNNYYMMAIIR